MVCRQVLGGPRGQGEKTQFWVAPHKVIQSLHIVAWHTSGHPYRACHRRPERNQLQGGM